MSVNTMVPKGMLRPGVGSIIATCAAITALDGLDLTLFSAVLPTLLETKEWGIVPVAAGVVGSMSLAGMIFGAMLAGYLTDVIGRRPVILVCVAAFSVFTALGAIAPNIEVFGLFRLLSGLGFGGVLPTVIALMMEYVRVDRRQFYNGLIQTGFPVGSSLLAAAAIFVIPTLGWRALFVLGGILGLIVFLVALKTLPESITFLAAKGRHDQARRNIERYAVDTRAEAVSTAPNGSDGGSRTTGAIRKLFAPGYRIATVMFPLICFCGLMASYAMNTWIPQILRASGYDLGSALLFLVALNIGSIVGMLALSSLADRWGSRPVISVGFVLGALSICLLTMHPTQTITFALVMVIGFSSASVIAVYGFVGVHYPSQVRGTALGLALGLGRFGGVLGPILIGLILGSFGSQWAFYSVAAVATAAAVLVVAVPRIVHRVTTAPIVVKETAARAD